MIEGLVGSVGLLTLVLIIVGLALLVVVVLLMSYFNVLLSIADFTFPNAKFRAHGTSFLKEETVSPMLESRNINEVFSKVREEGYDIPKEATEDMDEVEKHLESSTLKFLKRARNISPDRTKPLVDAWLNRYDVKMLKKAVKAQRGEYDKEEIQSMLFPVKIVDEDTIESMASARNIQELSTVLKETEFADVLAGMDIEEDTFLLDTELDKFAFEKLKKAVMEVHAEERSPVKYFIGKYTDIFNLKVIMRGLREDVEDERMKDCLLPDGWELKRWKLENMLESKNMEEALVELEGTSYAELRKEGVSKEPFEIEKELDVMLLGLTSKIWSEQVLGVGPLLKYLVGKEFELRNLKIILRGLKEGASPDRMRDMIILEDYT